jgi:hypothetical protein
VNEGGSAFGMPIGCSILLSGLAREEALALDALVAAGNIVGPLGLGARFRRCFTQPLADYVPHFGAALRLNALLRRRHDIDNRGRRFPFLRDVNLRRVLLDLGADELVHGASKLVRHLLRLEGSALLLDKLDRDLRSSARHSGLHSEDAF